ncbi:MAG: DUF3488 and transglutaminase-like domain-containing protein [Acidobacteriota bacterium]
MTFGREKRLWLGALALLAPIPLPFNQVLEWPFLFAYSLCLIYFLQRAEQGSWLTLGNWALNLLGLVYLPIFYVDLQAAFVRGSAVTALLHLILFLVVVKLFSIRREKDKWHIVIAIYFLFVGAMATSSHVSIMPYLATFLILSLLLLGRFAHLHMMVGAGEDRTRAARLPFRAPLTVGTFLILLVAVPLFATMPRIREPYILGRGSGSSGIARTTGFSDSVDLSLTTTVRGNRNVALRVQYDDVVQMGDPGNLRFKGAAYDTYRNRNWFRALREAEVLVPTSATANERFFRLGEEREPVNQASFFLEPINSFSVILPVEALSIRLDNLTGMGIDPGGAVLMPARPQDTLKYEVELAARPVIHARLDDTPGSALSALDQSGLTPRMIDLAQQVMGEGSVEERIDRLEQHLLTQYAYTLDFLGRTGENPLEEFLFEYKSGHCEFFASAMVLMLRSQGIPARFVTGFLGAELNPIEDYFVVRQQNAHAWVEAYSELRGWQIYDPTPPDGRPTVEPQSLSLLLSQVYDYINFRWDRYVLTYGAADQDSFFRSVRERLQQLWGKVKNLGQDEPEQPETPFADELALPDDAPTPQVWQPRLPLLVLLMLFAAAVAEVTAWNRRRPLSGEAAYLLLRRQLSRAGLEIPETLAPLDLQQRATERFPAAAVSIRPVIELYVRESFAEQPLAVSERQVLRDALQSLGEVLRAEAKQRRQRRRTGGRPLPAST